MNKIKAWWQGWRERQDAKGPLNTPSYVRRQRILLSLGVIGFPIMFIAALVGLPGFGEADDPFRWFLIVYCTILWPVSVYVFWAAGAKADQYEAKRLERIAKREARRQ